MCFNSKKDNFNPKKVYYKYQEDAVEFVNNYTLLKFVPKSLSIDCLVRCKLVYNKTSKNWSVDIQFKENNSEWKTVKCSLVCGNIDDSGEWVTENGKLIDFRNLSRA